MNAIIEAQNEVTVYFLNTLLKHYWPTLQKEIQVNYNTPPSYGRELLDIKFTVTSGGRYKLYNHINYKNYYLCTCVDKNTCWHFYIQPSPQKIPDERDAKVMRHKVNRKFRFIKNPIKIEF